MSLSTINIAPIEHYLRAMTVAEATDLMLTAHTQPRMRVDGRLSPIDGQPVLTPDDMRQAISALLTTELHAELYEKKEVDFSSRTATRTASVVTASSSRESWRSSLRSIPLAIPSFDTLLLPWAVSTSAACRRASCSSTGPTARKSTTLASMIDYINSRDARSTSSRSRT
jgi:twitching motility protein PilT